MRDINKEMKGQSHDRGWDQLDKILWVPLTILFAAEFHQRAASVAYLRALFKLYEQEQVISFGPPAESLTKLDEIEVSIVDGTSEAIDRLFLLRFPNALSQLKLRV